ncbi:chemotaxis protein CheW [Pseudomonas sp. dw_358]|uniref:chemotaxis protein CheW n=1 Tax=Pseudomonas sp. dw_358 TaxID=2720083 RepID=UPI001BD6C813|nr:chemotaxis protein CheW [Pseudomonas sp. dw_358]
MRPSRTAFELLLGIDQRCRQRAASLPSQNTRLQSWSGIGFRLGEVWYVAPMGEVAEVLPPGHATRMPGVKPWVQGVANLRGRLLPLLDLGGYLGHGLGLAHKERRVLVVDHQDIFAGLLVDEVSGLQHFAPHNLDLSPAPALEPAVAPYVQGVFRRELAWHVFSPFALVQAAAFRDVAI